MTPPRRSQLLTALLVLVMVQLLPFGGVSNVYAQSAVAERQALLAGVTRIGVNNGAVTGPLALFAPGAFAVVTAPLDANVRAPVVAAGPLDAGRVVAFGHPAFFTSASRQVGETGQLVLNSVRWAARSQQPLVAVKLGGSDQTDMIAFLQAQGFQTQALQIPLTSAQLVGVGAVIMDIGSLSTTEAGLLQTYVRNGGGLLASGLGWAWAQGNPGRSLENYPANKLAAPVGIAWSDAYIRDTVYPVETTMSRLVSADSALDLVLSPNPGTATPADLKQAVGTLRLVASALPASATQVWARAEPLIASAATVVPTQAAPLKATSQTGALVGTAFLVQRQLQQPPATVGTHPAAHDFPGPVPTEAPRVTRTITIDAGASRETSGTRWYSTGLYAAPGELITIDIPAEAVAKKLLLRIGAHSDRLWLRDEWWRFPVIDRVTPLASEQTQAANTFGGLIYLVVPARSDLGSITVTISGGVEAPRFVLGQTSLAAWRDQIRYLPGPWAELESASLILTVQSEVIRTLDNPHAFMQFWERVQEANHDFAGWAPGRERPMRIVFDR